MGIPFDKVERVQWRVDDGEINECEFRIVNGIKYVPERTCKRIIKTNERPGKTVFNQWFACSECEKPLGHSAHYCSNCGSKVIG